MKISFYLNLDSLQFTDLRYPENGNPGIGGTEFMIWQLSYYLQKNTKHDVILLTTSVNKLPKDLKTIKVANIIDATIKAKELDTDIFIFRAVNDYELYCSIEKLKLTSIAWGHNFSDGTQLRIINKTKAVVRYVCVSKEQYDLLRDHDIYKKCCYIYNSLDFRIYQNTFEDPKERIVCYIGSIVPSKGFHVLAKNWQYVEKKCPNAKLYVIGSGNLYNSKAKLGKYGIAEKRYEEKFMKYLIKKDGSIKDNIKFFGVLGGQEKINVMEKAKVGVVNPTARTETFGIGAVEFQALKIPVVAKAKNGYYDTIDTETGILFKNYKGMTKGIVKLLLEEKKTYAANGRKSRKFVIAKFDIFESVKKWDSLFWDIYNNKEVNNTLNFSNMNNNLKWIREVNRRVKSFRLFKRMPSIIDYENYAKILIKGKK